MDNVAILRSGYDAFGRGDIPAVLELLDPEIEWTVPDTVGPGSPYNGPEAVAGFFGSLQHTWLELYVEPDELIQIGDDRVLVLGHIQGRVENGASAEIPFAHLWRLRDGRAVRFFEYSDTALVLRAQGLVPEPAAA